MDETNSEYEVVEYLKDNLDAASLRNILSMLNIPASELIRKGEPAYKENFKGKELTEEEWISAMVEFPKLIERPIIVKGNKAIIARPLERIEELG
jgi:arsenate reductase (glutaredoxin)